MPAAFQIRRSSRSSSTLSRGVSVDRANTPSQGEFAMISRETAHLQNLRRIASTRFDAIGAPRSTMSSSSRFTSRREISAKRRPRQGSTISFSSSRTYSLAVLGLFDPADMLFDKLGDDGLDRAALGYDGLSGRLPWRDLSRGLIALRVSAGRYRGPRARRQLARLAQSHFGGTNCQLARLAGMAVAQDVAFRAARLNDKIHAANFAVGTSRRATLGLMFSTALAVSRLDMCSLGATSGYRFEAVLSVTRVSETLRDI